MSEAKHILVVDDEEDVRDTLEKVLKSKSNQNGTWFELQEGWTPGSRFSRSTHNLIHIARIPDVSDRYNLPAEDA